jgi:hypothetical protein
VSGLPLRWIGGAVLALLVSVAGLELSVCLAGEHERAFAHASAAGLLSAAIDDELVPVGEEVDDADASSRTSLTR